MVRKKKTFEDEKYDPIKIMEQTREDRKMVQDANWKKYDADKKLLKEEIEANEGIDIQEFMLKDRRDWTNKQMIENPGKIPDDITKYYQSFLVEDILSPEEEAARKAEDEEAKSAKKGKKDKKKEKKGKGKKAGGGEDDPMKDKIKMGNSEVNRRFDEQY